MQIILASAKIMNDRVKSIPDISLSTPRFQNEAEGFARDMVQYSAESIAEMLGCSQQIAAQNRLRYMRFFDDAAKLPAILAYHGQAYKHLKAETLTVDDLDVAQGEVVDYFISLWSAPAFGCYSPVSDGGLCRTAERRGSEYVRFLEEASDRHPD